MKRFTILWIFCLLLINNDAFGQDPACIAQGRINIDGIGFPGSPAKVYFYSTDLTTIYGQYTLNSGYFNTTVTPQGVNFYMVVNIPGTGWYIYPANGSGSQFTATCQAFDNIAGFDFSDNFPITGPACPSLACVLPVQFLSFTAKAEENTVRLDWATNLEEDNEYFTVERSFDGTNFNELARIPGAGNTVITHNYTWIDESPLPGITYYRIKQTDFDGTYAYSDVASVKLDAVLAQTMRIFPNPAETSVRIVIPSVGKSGMAVLRVFNHVGQLILMEERNTEGQLLELDTSTLPGGLYTLHVQQGTRSFSDKLIVN